MQGHFGMAVLHVLTVSKSLEERSITQLGTFVIQ